MTASSADNRYAAVRNDYNLKSAKNFEPTLEQLEAELMRRHGSNRRKRTLRSILFSLLVVAACAVLVAMLWTPVMQAYGTSMEPMLKDGDILIAVKNTRLIEREDIVAFYYGDKVLLKRVIGLAGDKINIDANGNVYLNGKLLDEPYISQKALGDCDIELPATVPENAIFVLGDHRSISVDSRSSDIGMIFDEKTIGKVVLRVWPFKSMGTLN